jgi:CRISPR-associated protein Cmr6
VGTGSSVTDGSILLHHTWGIPYLPGSALKGLARAALTAVGLRHRTLIDQQVLGQLLGQGPSDEGSERSAFLDFLDAPWVPLPPEEQEQPTRSPLALDVVTPHHSRYYTQSSERRFPTDFDEPVPTHRLSISPQTRFHLVIEAHESVPTAWLNFMMDDVLLPALQQDGIGAWTTSGYGRLEVP